jgi:RimJ/RimL family protein N-acetyltransferase
MFSQFKGSTFENSYFFIFDPNLERSPTDLSFQCKVAGPWLLNFKSWLEQMTDVRDLNKEMYFSRFPPSLNSLTRYLIDGPIENPNQILFMIVDQVGTLHGHIGLKLDRHGNVNVDNVLRISGNSPGAMRMALQKILTWGNETLGISEYSLQVISTNERAIAFYKELGFFLHQRISLRIEHFLDETTNLVPSTVENSNTRDEMLIMRIAL